MTLEGSIQVSKAEKQTTALLYDASEAQCPACHDDLDGAAVAHMACQ